MSRKREPPHSAFATTTVPDAWTDTDVFEMRETLLVETMTAAVDRRSSDQTRADAWEWIEADDEHPFSFRVCAKAMGADPDELRRMFRSEAARLGLTDIPEN